MKQMVYSTLAIKVGSWGDTGRPCVSWPHLSSARPTASGGDPKAEARGLPAPPDAGQPRRVAFPLLAYHREVGLLHLLQQDPQGHEVQDDVVGLLQACAGWGRAWGARVSNTPASGAPRSASGRPAPHHSPSVTFKYTFCRAGQ